MRHLILIWILWMRFTNTYSYFKYFRGIVYGSGYCNKVLACKRFARIKCSECGSNFDEILLENEEALGMGSQRASFAVNCLSDKRRVCGPLDASWLDVEDLWLKNCKGDVSSFPIHMRTRRQTDSLFSIETRPTSISKIRRRTIVTSRRTIPLSKILLKKSNLVRISKATSDDSPFGPFLESEETEPNLMGRSNLVVVPSMIRTILTRPKEQMRSSKYTVTSFRKPEADVDQNTEVRDDWYAGKSKDAMMEPEVSFIGRKNDQGFRFRDQQVRYDSGKKTSPPKIQGIKSKLHQFAKVQSLNEIFHDIKYQNGMNTDKFIDRVEKYCEALLVLSPKVEVDDQNMDLKSRQNHLQLRKRMAWCAFLKNLEEQKKLCQSDYSKCERVEEVMPGGITMNFWIYKSEQEPKAEDEKLQDDEFTVESKTQDQNFLQERLLQKLTDIEQQQQEIKEKMRDQENQRSRENGRLDKLFDERSKSNKLEFQKRITDSRSRTKLFSEAKSKLNILLVILKGLEKESEKMTEKQIEYESKLKKNFDRQNQMMLEYRSIIDYISESLLEHRKLITEIENVMENLNNSILEIVIKHENPETGGQEIGQQTWSTFIYYLQEASNTIKFFNQNHQMIHSETENRIKNFRAKNIVQNLYQFVYAKGKTDCEDCSSSATTVIDQNDR